MKHKMFLTVFALALFVGGSFASGALTKVGARAAAPKCNCAVVNGNDGPGIIVDGDCKKLECWVEIEATIE